MLPVQFHVAQRADETAAGFARDVRGFVRVIKARGLAGIGDSFANDALLHRTKQCGKGSYQN
jgi:hypothetical protein